MISNLAFLSRFLDAKNDNLLYTEERIHNCYRYLILKSDVFAVLGHKQFIIVQLLIGIALIVDKKTRIFNIERLKFYNDSTQ